MDVISQETTNQNYLCKTQWKPFWKLCKIAMKVQINLTQIRFLRAILKAFALLYLNALLPQHHCKWYFNLNLHKIIWFTPLPLYVCRSDTATTTRVQYRQYSLWKFGINLSCRSGLSYLCKLLCHLGTYSMNEIIVHVPVLSLKGWWSTWMCGRSLMGPAPI